MLLKWIVCTVREEMREAFSHAQTKWTGLADVQGFLGQFGGWDLKSEHDACILAIWQDHESYKAFMNHQHDRIFQDNEQAKTYDAISVSLLQPICDMPGSHQDMLECLTQAKAIRVADCLVKPEREQHFIEAQQKIWIPGMNQAKGMLAGSFSKVISNDTRYVVTTLWESVKAHHIYVERTLPSLQEAADVSRDIQRITGRLLQVDADWFAAPTPHL